MLSPHSPVTAFGLPSWRRRITLPNSRAQPANPPDEEGRNVPNGDGQEIQIIAEQNLPGREAGRSRQIIGGKANQLREEIRAADDLDRMWPGEDLIDAVGLIVVTKKRMVDHFVAAGKHQMSLGELMDMCLDRPVEGYGFMSRLY